MSTYVALLRGINVGGRNLVAMAQLRELFADMGYQDVQTYIQSGNVIFTSGKKPQSEEIEAAIEGRFGVVSTTVLRTPSELKTTMARNPFDQVESAELHVGFMARRPPKSALLSLDSHRFLPDHFTVVGREVYLHIPGGMARTKVPGYVNRQLAVPITLRNWNSLTKLVELSGT